MKRFTILILSTLFLFSCSEEENSINIERPTSAFRLKHLTTAAQVADAIGDFATGWQWSDIDLTSIGPYPRMPYIYYYDIYMHRGTDPNRQIISFRVQAGGPVDSDVTLEAYLEEHPDMVAVNTSRLRDYPGVYLVKGKDNNIDKWVIELYTPHIAKDGNHTMHSIDMYSYGSTPPPADDVAVDVMVRLLEENKE